MLTRPDLDRMLPAVGLALPQGIEYLLEVCGGSRRSHLDETGRAVVSYFADLLANLDRLRTLIQELDREGPALVDAAFETAREYLPRGATVGSPRLVVLPLGFDFRTDRETVYMDPLAALSLGRAGIQTTLAHELHHVARFRLTGENLTLMRPDSEIVPSDVRGTFGEWAEWLEAEGIADCASNMTQTDVPALRQAAAERRRQIAEYSGLLTETLGLFRAAWSTGTMAPSELSGLRRRARGLAHPVGYGMAREIMTALGPEVLVNCVGRPRAFLMRYNEASGREGKAGIDQSLMETVGPSGPHR